MITPNLNAGAEQNAPAKAATENVSVVAPGLQIEEITMIISEAPNALATNRTSVERAINAGNDLLNRIQAEGMSEDLDAVCNNYLVRNNTTLKQINERRSPITQILTAIAKEFTTLEAQIDLTKANTPANKIQAARDLFAKQQAEQRKKAEAEAARKLAADKERAQLKADAEVQINKNFSDHLNDRLSMLQLIFNGVTLENYTTRLQELHEFATAYSFNHFDTFAPRLMPIYCNAVELQNIVTNAKLGKYEEFALQFENSVAVKRMELIDRMPSLYAEKKQAAEQAERERIRIAELEKTNAAAAAEAQRLQNIENERLAQLQREREAAAAEKLAAEAAQREAAAAATIESNRQANLTEALFDAQVVASAAPEISARVREGFEIIVLNQIGYLLLAQFYFEKEGKTEAIEKLEKKTLGSMKKFAETYAMKSDGKEKIVSPFLIYEEKIKTVVKK